MPAQPLIKEKVAEKLTFVIFIVIPVQDFLFCSSYSVLADNLSRLHHDDYKQFSAETFYIIINNNSTFISFEMSCR